MSVLSTTTVALGTAAPDESVTVPLMLPLPEVWAESGTAGGDEEEDGYGNDEADAGQSEGVS